MRSTSLVPFRDLDDAFDRLFDLRRWPLAWRGDREPEWKPATDISETDREFIVKAELPEVKKEDISVELDGNMLTLKGERKQEKEEKDKTMHRVERFHGTFVRSFALPDNVDAKEISAEVKDGVLQVRLPKRSTPEKQPTKIAVK